MNNPTTRSPVSGSRFLVGQLARDLASVVGPENVEADPDHLQGQASDWSWMSRYLLYRDLEHPAADVAVRPRTTEEVEQIVRMACDHRIPIVPRGGGTGTQGGTFALYGGISLDLSRMTDIIDLDEESLVITVQAGIDGPTMEKALNDRGLTFAHYPGSYHMGATVGGFLAARGSGVVSTKYGKAEDLAVQVKAVVAPGLAIETLTVPSHAAGPDLLQTFIGSEGTLGVITEATMRVDPIPESRDFLSFSFPNMYAGIEAGRRLMAARVHPSVIRLYDEADSRKLQDWVGTPFTGTLMVVMTDGPTGLVEWEVQTIIEIAEQADGHSLGPDVGRTWWEGKYEPYAKGKLPQPPLLYGTIDTVARFSALPAIYRERKAAIEDGFAEYGARYTAHLSHWYPWGAMIYDRFYVDEPPSDPAEAMSLHDRLWNVGVEIALKHGGTINDHHGVGHKLGRFMRPQYGPGFELLRSLKDAWDPDGLMNPGKLGFGPPRSRGW